MNNPTLSQVLEQGNNVTVSLELDSHYERKQPKSLQLAELAMLRAERKMIDRKINCGSVKFIIDTDGVHEEKSDNEEMSYLRKRRAYLDAKIEQLQGEYDGEKK